MHLGARHQLAAQQRRQLAVGDILGEQLKSELFSELDIYEEAVEKEKQDAYDKRMYERALNGLSPPEKKAVNKIFSEGAVFFAHGFTKLRKRYHVREFEKLAKRNTLR